jgi:NADH/NAD ratio-sensing transcriptional regulator Rex
MNTRSNVVLKFDSNLNEVVRLTIPRANLSLDAAQAQAVMEDMIAGGIITTSNGTPTAINSAKLVTTQRTPLI